MRNSKKWDLFMIQSIIKFSIFRDRFQILAEKYIIITIGAIDPDGLTIL